MIATPAIRSRTTAGCGDEGFLELTVAKARGGGGRSFLSHTIAYEALGQGCPATALAFNMHASVVMPLLQSPQVTDAAKQHIADLVVRQHRLIGGNFSEPGTTSLVGARPLSVRARRVGQGYSVTGRKMFASMLEAADHVLGHGLPRGRHQPRRRHPASCCRRPSPAAASTPTGIPLALRATRSDSLVLDDCWVPDSAR